MCLPDTSYQTFETIAGRQVFVPVIVAALPGLSMSGILAGRDFAYLQDKLFADANKRRQAKLRSWGATFPALRGQDRHFSNVAVVGPSCSTGRSSFGWLRSFDNIPIPEAA